MAWVPYWVGYHVGILRPVLNHFMIFLSWGGSKYDWYHAHTSQIDTRSPIWGYREFTFQVCFYLPLLFDDLGEYCVGTLCQWCHRWLFQFCWLFLLGGIMFFLVWCMWTLVVVIDGGRFLLIRYIFKLGHIANYHFSIAWMRLWLTVLNIVVWYHFSRSGLVLSTIKLFSDWRVGVGLDCGVVDRCTWHSPYYPLWVTSSNN